jgi:hypothetical protein
MTVFSLEIEYLRIEIPRGDLQVTSFMWILSPANARLQNDLLALRFLFSSKRKCNGRIARMLFQE